MTGALLLALTALASLTPQAKFSHGLPSQNSYFPIAVWLQDPSNAPKYKAAGFDLFVGLWQGPTEEQLRQLKSADMPVICEQNAVGLKHRDDPTIVGWMHGDEPDNAQEVKDPVTGKTGYGPCIPPSKIVAEYQRMHQADPTRPVMLNLGQGVANDEWIGRGNGSSLSDYQTYVKGGDIVSFDIYPIAGLPKPDPENYLWLVGKGLDRLSGWMENGGVADSRKWNCIECTRIGGDRKPTPAQVATEVWMSIIHGSRGLIYFVHQFKPTFDEHALLDDPEMLEAVTNLNLHVLALGGLLNNPSVNGVVDVKSSVPTVPIDTMVKKVGPYLWVFTMGMRNETTTGAITIKGLPKHAKAAVQDENRSVEIVDGKFTDTFKPYAHHLYRITLETK